MTGAISPPGNGIFISYRRADTAYPAGWLFELLAARFGADRVFKDVDSVQPGDDFVEEIRAAVGSCGVLLAVIGKHWLAMASEDGRRRLDNPADMVRLEIEAALKRHVRVIPVLVDGASMPGTAQLPRSLSKLAYRQAVELSPQRFSSDARRLIRTLDQELAHDPAPTAPAGAEAPASAGVPDPVETKLHTASTDVHRWLRRFVQEQVKIHGADVVPGPGDLKYLRLTLPGARRKAAYCYVTTRGYVDFRLPKTAAQNRQRAYARDVKDDGTNCAVRLRLNSQGALTEALQLAAEAAAASQISPEQRGSPTASSVSSAPEGEPPGAGDTGRRLAVMKRFDVPAGKGLDREQASRAFTENGYNPRSFGGWVRRGWITRDGDRRYLTGKGRQWVADQESGATEN